jgi:hypothetical protein
VAASVPLFHRYSTAIPPLFHRYSTRQPLQRATRWTVPLAAFTGIRSLDAGTSSVRADRGRHTGI